MAQAPAPAPYGESSPTAPNPATAASSSASALVEPSAQPQPPPSQSQSQSQSEAQTQAQQQQHKRVYQACIPCRRRKVRCDLGSVDNPHDPPCVRCRRESKECYFSATRRKRKTDDGEDVEDEYIVRNGRKRVHTEASPPPQLDRRLYSDVPLTPGGSIGRPQPLRRPGPGEHARSGSRSSAGAPRDQNATEFPTDAPNVPLENYEARSVMRKEVYNPHDALDLLYKAAREHTHDTRPQTRGLRTPSVSVAAGVVPRESDGVLYARHAAGHRPEAPIDPQLRTDHRPEPVSVPAHADAIKAWTRFRFVRAGWFTAQEAVDYID